MSADGQYLRLETIGRNTGKTHQVILRYIVSGGKIILFPQNSGVQDWFNNIAHNPSVKIFYQEKLVLGKGEIRRIISLNDPILDTFTRKYGSSITRRYYWGQHSYVQISITQPTSSISFSEIVYGDLEAAFDSVAEDYDHHILDNPVNTWLRNISISKLHKLFQKGETVLEVGCGTGTETITLAKKGVKVVAVDISSKMLDVLSRKARAHGLSDRIRTVHCRPIEIKSKLKSLGIESLDGAYSTYGAVNTEPNLDSMLQNMHSVMKPEAPLLLGIWNKFCVYEIMGYLVTARPTLALARLRNPVPIGKSRFCVASNAFTVGMLNQHLKNLFKLKNVYGVVILMPPSNLTRYLPTGKLLSALKKVDLSLGATFPANRLGDHFLAEYRRI